MALDWSRCPAVEGVPGKVSQAAPRLQVMDLKIFRSPAALATPAVALQDLMAELAVGFSL